MIVLEELSRAFPMYWFTTDDGTFKAWSSGSCVATLWENSDGTWTTVAASCARNSECASAIDAVEWATGTPESIGSPRPNFAAVCANLAVTLTEKNARYGNSFAVTGDFLRLLWPDGCKPDDFDRIMLCARMFDKMKRLATAKPGDDEDPLLDLAGYAVLGLATKMGVTP